MIVGIDFDRVLFDTDTFNEAMKEATGLHHVDAEVYDENGNYSPRKHAEAAGVDPEKICSFMENGTGRFLYDDVDRIEELDHEVWIVTRGREKFQRAKIRESDVDEMVDRVVIIEDGDKDAGIDFLIDDRKEELEMADLPGYVLDRSEETLEDAIEKVQSHEA